MKFLRCHGYPSQLWSLPVRGAWVEIADVLVHVGAQMSLPVRGAWVEIANAGKVAVLEEGRSPCGERGLKLLLFGLAGLRAVQSLPVRGAWVEIGRPDAGRLQRFCRSPCGERGLKFRRLVRPLVASSGRSPCGERGLK